MGVNSKNKNLNLFDEINVEENEEERLRKEQEIKDRQERLKKQRDLILQKKNEER